MLSESTSGATATDLFGDATTSSDRSPRVAPKPRSSTSGVVNVRQVPQLSPFRYPGGKTWLAPLVGAWLARRGGISTLLEPFAGGGGVSLFVALYGPAHVRMVEIDEDVSSVWLVATGDDDGAFDRLTEEITTFEVTSGTVAARLEGEPSDVVDRAFRTILRNRVNRGGILAPGAYPIKRGERDKGMGSRWYPGTLVTRLARIRRIRSRIGFTQGDAFEALRSVRDDRSVAAFVDPPYTAGGAKVGSRLYRHSDVDHDALFAAAGRHAGPVLMTYDDVPEVRDLASAHGLAVRTVMMSGTRNTTVTELLVGRPDDEVLDALVRGEEGLFAGHRPEVTEDAT